MFLSISQRSPGYCSVRQAIAVSREVQKQLRECAQKASLDFLSKPAYNVKYEGLYPLSPDGLTDQVSWSVGNDAPTTTSASQNTYHNIYVPTAKERRRQRILDEAIEKQERAEEVVRAVKFIPL